MTRPGEEKIGELPGRQVCSVSGVYWGLYRSYRVTLAGDALRLLCTPYASQHQVLMRSGGI